MSLVIGNGESRRFSNPSSFNHNNIIIGCNAIHRDMQIDHLVCCDRRMVEEAVKSLNTARSKIYVRPDWFRYFRKIRKDKRILQTPELPYDGELKQDKPIHWGSGSYAVLLGAMLDDETHLLGFDLYPTNDNINNLYKGTPNYNPKNSKPVDYSFWIYQIAMVFKYFPNNKFVIHNKHDWQIPFDWKKKNVFFEKF